MTPRVLNVWPRGILVFGLMEDNNFLLFHSYRAKLTPLGFIFVFGIIWLHVGSILLSRIFTWIKRFRTQLLMNFWMHKFGYVAVFYPQRNRLTCSLWEEFQACEHIAHSRHALTPMHPSLNILPCRMYNLYISTCKMIFTLLLYTHVRMQN